MVRYVGLRMLTSVDSQKLISKMDSLTNLQVFKSIQISLACQACIDAEKTHEWYVYVCINVELTVIVASCSNMWCYNSLHMQHLIPRWQDKHRRLKIIMSDRPDLINSEMGGVAFNSVDQCFKQVLLKQMFSDIIPVRIEFNTRFFVTIDPAAGGEHSDFAMVSFMCIYGIYKVRAMCITKCLTRFLIKTRSPVF